MLLCRVNARTGLPTAKKFDRIRKKENPGWRGALAGAFDIYLEAQPICPPPARRSAMRYLWAPILAWTLIGAVYGDEIAPAAPPADGSAAGVFTTPAVPDPYLPAGNL